MYYVKYLMLFELQISFLRVLKIKWQVFSLYKETFSDLDLFLAYQDFID